MRTYQLQDFANPISVAVTNPSQSGYSRFVGLEHYDSGELVVKRYSGTELLTTTAKAFETNDILIARRNVYLKRAGIVFFDGITSGDTIVLRIKNDCESTTGVPKDLAQRIIPIVLNSEHFWIYANKHADGMNSKRISKEMLLTYEFELPSLEEQRVLADKLWAAYEVKESYKNLLAQTDKLLHAQFQKMFGEEFEKKSLCDICRPKQWPTIQTKDFTKEGYLVYGANGVIGRYSEYNHENSTILMACRGASCGAINISEPKSYITGNAMCIDDINDDVVFEYLQYFLSNYDYRGIISGGAQPQITYASLCKLFVPVPPIELQQEFTTIFKKSEKTKASLNKGIEAIEAVIRSLIAEGTTKV